MEKTGEGFRTESPPQSERKLTGQDQFRGLECGHEKKRGSKKKK